MLKMVRTPISRRTGATFFMAGWWLGANMKPMPVAWMHSATCGACRSMRAPRASSTSAEPDFDETPRLPCLATVAPAAAATKAEAVEMLKVWRRIAAGADDVDEMRVVRRLDAWCTARASPWRRR
jgi:hypothetical protein